MNTRKIIAIMGAMVTGGVFVTIGSVVGDAEAGIIAN